MNRSPHRLRPAARGRTRRPGSSRTTGRRGSRGLTVPEVVALLAVTGVVIAVALAREPELGPASRLVIAEARLTTFETAMGQWKQLSVDDPTVPALPETLEQLRTGPPDYSGRWRSLVGGDAIPPDPWGRDWRYEVIDRPDGLWRVTCAGPDGRFDTADDLLAPAPDPDSSSTPTPTDR